MFGRLLLTVVKIAAPVIASAISEKILKKANNIGKKNSEKSPESENKTI